MDERIDGVTRTISTFEYDPHRHYVRQVFNRLTDHAPIIHYVFDANGGVLLVDKGTSVEKYHWRHT